MDEEVLISLVANYKELYDLQHPKYDDNQRRNNILEEIGGVLKQPGEKCKEKWKRIRDNYRRAKKLRRTKSGQAAVNKKNIKYEEILSFLTPYVEWEYETESNFTESPIGTGEDEEQVPMQEERESNSAASSSVSNTTVRKSFRKLKRQTEQSPSHTSSLFERYIEKKYSSLPNTDDRIVKFFTNLGETVKTLPEHIQIRVKRQVFKIVNEAEEEALRDNTNNRELSFVNSPTFRSETPARTQPSVTTELTQPQNQFEDMEQGSNLDQSLGQTGHLLNEYVCFAHTQ